MWNFEFDAPIKKFEIGNSKFEIIQLCFEFISFTIFQVSRLRTISTVMMAAHIYGV
jgi:hypothetical protein